MEQGGDFVKPLARNSNGAELLRATFYGGTCAGAVTIFNAPWWYGLVLWVVALIAFALIVRCVDDG